MKNSEIISAVVGTCFFAVPYAFLSVPVIPSVLIGATAFAAGELVFKKDEILNVEKTSFKGLIADAKNKQKAISNMENRIDDDTIRGLVKQISVTLQKIISSFENKPKMIKSFPNFFDYYLPVTVKVISRYDEIEDQDISSKEAKKFYVSTCKMLTDVNRALKKVLNGIYENDMIDTSAEAKVLDAMLKSDGLDDNYISMDKE